MLSAGSLPRIIFLIGADGVGKSTLADALVRELEKRDIATRRAWSRYNNYVSKPLLALARILGLSYYEKCDGHRMGYHDFSKSFIVKHLFVFLQAIDVNIAWFTKIRRRIPPCGVLICDRGPYDTLFDVMIDTGLAHLGRTPWLRAYTLLVRKHCKVFVVERDYQKTLDSTKTELRYDRNLSRKHALYNSYALELGWDSIYNNDSIERAVSEILQRLRLVTWGNET